MYGYIHDLDTRYLGVFMQCSYSEWMVCSYRAHDYDEKELSFYFETNKQEIYCRRFYNT